MATTEDTRAARDAKLDALHAKLTDAVSQLTSGEDWRQALEFAARFRARSFNNVMLIFTQHQLAYQEGRVPETSPTYVAGFKQWVQLGRHVEKGQQGYAILAPVTGRFASETPKIDSSWRRLARGERPQSGEITKTRMVGTRPAYVFDLSQTTGEQVPLPPRPVLLRGEAPVGLITGLTRLIEAAGYEVLPVPHEGMIDGANGMTDYDARQVAYRTNMEQAAQAKTLIHEHAHVLLHDPTNEDAVRHRGIAEVEAESVALMVAASHGMDTTDYTLPYVSGWAANVSGKDPVSVVQATAERSRRAAMNILDGIDTVQIGDGTPPGLAEALQTERDGSAQRRAPAATLEADLDRVRPVEVVRGL